jgi:hypothetical protein
MGWQDAPIVEANPQAQRQRSSWQNAPIVKPAAGPQSPPGAPQPEPAAQPASALERFGSGLADPFVGFTQAATHLIPKPVGDLLEKANDWIADEVGEPRSPRNLFTAQGVDQAVEKREKEIAKGSPKGTDWWRVAGEVASPANYAAPARLLGEMNAVRRIGSGVLQGAVTGGLQPVDSQGHFWDKKEAQAAIGGTVGGVVGLGAEPVRALANWALSLHGDAAAQSKAVKSVLQRVEADQKGGGATFQDMLDIANATPNKPLVLADVLDANAKNLLGRIARQRGEAPQQIKKFLNDRDLDTATRVTGDLADSFGNGAAYYADQSLQEARSRAAQPLYERAFSTNRPLDSDYLTELRETNPRIQEGMRRGWAIERDEAQGEQRPLNATDYGITSIDPDGTINLGQVPNLRLWNVVKKGLDAQIEDAKDKMTGRLTQEGVAINTLKNGVLRELDRLSPDYRAAREAWAGPTASMSALRDGQRWPSMQPEEIEHLFTRMGQGEKEFFRLGAANTIRKMMLTTGARGDETRKLMLPYAKMQLRAMFDSDAEFNRYFSSLNAEHKMWESWAKVNVGSNSADKLAEDLRADTYAASQGIRGAARLAAGDHAGGVADLVRGMGRYLPSDNPRVLKKTADLLTTPVPQAVKTLQGATNKIPTMRIYPKVIPGLVGSTTPNEKTGQ